MSVGSSRGTLGSSAKQLKLSWEQTRSYWRDSKSKEFETRYLAPLFEGIERAGPLLEELDRTLHQIKKDCE